MELTIIFWIMCAIAAAFVAHNRGARGLVWFFLGILFGPIGMIMAFASESERKCPHCRSAVYEEATRCHACGEVLPIAETPAKF